MNKRRPYVRSMDGWWRKNPFFVEYMIHEGTALFVAAYAAILLTGLVRLAQGEAALKNQNKTNSAMDYFLRFLAPKGGAK